MVNLNPLFSVILRHVSNGLTGHDPVKCIGFLIDVLVVLVSDDCRLLPKPDSAFDPADTDGAREKNDAQRSLLKMVLEVVQDKYCEFHKSVEGKPTRDRIKLLGPAIKAVLGAVKEIRKKQASAEGRAIITSISMAGFSHRGHDSVVVDDDSVSQSGFTFAMAGAGPAGGGGGHHQRGDHFIGLVSALITLSEGDPAAIADLAQILHIEIGRDQLVHLQRLFATLRTAQGIHRQRAAGAAPSAAEGMDMFEIVSTQIFNELDSEKRGRITFEDFAKALEQMHISLSTMEKRDLFMSAVRMRASQAASRTRGGGASSASVAHFDGAGGGADRGYLTLPEFQHALREIRRQFVERMLIRLRLTDTTIMVSVAWLGLVLMLLLTFFILGVIAFTDGTSFSAVVSAAIPMVGALVSAAQDPAKVQLLLSNVDSAAETFFQLLANDVGDSP